MGSPGGGVGGGSSSSGNSGGSSGSSGSDNDRGGNSGGPSGSDRDSSNDRDRASRSDSDRSSDQRGMTGSERTEAAFNDAMSNATSGPDTNDDDNDATDAGGGGFTDSAGETFGGLSSPAGLDNDTTADDAAQSAARESHHANEFDGLGPSGGPVDNSLPGDDSRNSHRGYGPDDSLAGGIDDDVNAGLEATEQLERQADFVSDAGLKGNIAQAGVEKARNRIDYQARTDAAKTLTNGNAANLPGRADLAKDITDTRVTARQALDMTPYGPNANSTQQLADGASRAAARTAAATALGLGVQPAAGALKGYAEAPEDAGPFQTATNTAREAVKEVDDATVSFASGAVAAAGVTTVSAAMGPVAGPPTAVYGAPTAGLGAAVGMGALYNDSPIDKGIDAAVDVVFDGVEYAAKKADDAISYVADQIDNWEEGITEKAIRDFQSSAKWRR